MQLKINNSGVGWLDLVLPKAVGSVLGQDGSSPLTGISVPLFLFRKCIGSPRGVRLFNVDACADEKTLQ